MGALDIVDEDERVKLGRGEGGGCFYFPFSEWPLFCLSNFLYIVRITCHGILFIFLHNRPSTGDRSGNLIGLFSK